jgi:hypothetical protein
VTRSFGEALQTVKHLFSQRKTDPDIRLNEGDPTDFLKFSCPQIAISLP